MALFKKKNFEELANEHGEYCISIYIPTHRDKDNKDSQIRLKNQINRVEYQLTNLGFKNVDINQYLDPVKELLEDSGLWKKLSDALIIFRNANKFEYHTLPLDVEEFSRVSNQFYILPLLSSFNNNDTFFILRLSMNDNSLYEANQNEIIPIVTENDLPENINESSGSDVKQKSLQFRTGQSGQESGMYHGKGEGKDDKKIEIIKYLSEVDKGLNKILDGYNAPLVIASVDYIFSLYKEVSKYKNIYPESISGNYDNNNILLVHEKACEILKPYFNESRNRLKQQYDEKQNKTTSNINEMVNAALAGSIDTLFVKKHNHIWGNIEKDTGAIVIQDNKSPHNECLLDFTARSTFLSGGNVFLEEPEELPDPDSKANAILRY